MSGITLTTIGDLIANGHRIHVHCQERPGGIACDHSAWLDLEALAERLGRDHGCLHQDLARKFVCPRCGARNAGISLHPPPTRLVA